MIQKKISLQLQTALGLIIAILCLALIFSAQGWRLFVVQTPSMGQTAPVGSLVVSQTQETYKPGDVISFYRNSRIYTHRIVNEKDGKFTTKGDMNGSNDPWLTNKDDIIAKSRYIIYHAGWLAMALPWLFFGWIIVYLISCWRRISPEWRWPIRIIGSTFVVVFTSLWLHPWINIALLNYFPSDKGGIDMHIVNTGIFPIKAEGVRLTPGENATINIRYADSGSTGRYTLMPRPSLGFWGIIWVMLFCLTPLLIAIFIQVPHQRNRRIRSISDTPKESLFIDRYPYIIIVLIILLSVIILSMQLSTLAAFTASIRNSVSRARTSTWFNCENYLKSNPKPVIAFAMKSSGNQSEINGGLVGQARGNFSFDANDRGSCQRDGGGALIYEPNSCLGQYSGGGNIQTSDYSLEVWFKTNDRNSNGKLIGMGHAIVNSVTIYESETQNDRNLYIDKTGRVIFAIRPDSVQYIASPAGINYADNNWHHAVATLSSVSGSRLYVDGNLVAQNSQMKRARELATGWFQRAYWKFGCGGMANWRNGDGTRFDGRYYYRGRMRFGAIYETVLTQKQVLEHYLAGSTS